MAQPVPGPTTNVEVDIDPLTGETTVTVTQFSDATKSHIISKEVRRFPRGGNWDHYTLRIYDQFIGRVVIGLTSRVAGWEGDNPTGSVDKTSTYEHHDYTFPGSSYHRVVSDLKAVVINDSKGVRIIVIFENYTDGSPAKGVTIPIAPPGPPQIEVWPTPGTVL
jgi:hypothetical protein